MLVGSCTRNLDGIDLDGVSVEQDGGAKRPTPEEILKPQVSAKRRRWNTFFLLSCAVAVFNDPLYCYVRFIDSAATCVNGGWVLAVINLLVRFAVDVFYCVDLLISCLGIRNKREKIAKTFGACWKRSDNQKTADGDQQCNFTLDPKLLHVISRILVALPILEIFIIAGSLQALLFFIWTPIQYTIRVHHVYGSLRQRPIIGTGTKRWLKPILDFVPFILASHLFGAIWYFLAVQRQIDCWSQNCKAITGFECNFAEIPCGKYPNVANMEELTPKVFDFGIYLFALQSKVTDSNCSFPKRLLQSAWWALRNLSSFGSNLNSSTNPLEIIFCVLISISGMALFLVYLNARVQESQEWSNRLKQKERMQLAKPGVDLWLSKYDFPGGLKKRTNRKMNMREMIMENIHKLDEKKDYDVQSILSILPITDRRRILYHLRLASLRKVPLLVNVIERVLREISEHLKPVIYAEDSYIVQEGKPLSKMLFITHGIALTYTTCKNSVGTSTQCLQKGDFYGAELLDWAFKFSSFTDLPISTGTVISQEKVEAFVIRPNDLKSVVSKYWWYFSREFCQTENSQMKERDHLDASFVQAAWRRGHPARVESQTDHHYVRVEGSTGWGRLTAS